MALTVHTATIDGVTYQAEAWPTTLALQMAARLVDIFGSAGIAMLSHGFAPDKIPALAEGDKDPRLSMVYLLQSMANIDAEHNRDSTGFIRECMRRVTADHVRIGNVDTAAGHVVTPAGVTNVFQHYDTHFAGRYGHLYNVLAWVTRVSFSLSDDASR